MGAFWLRGHRDLGAGVWAARPGPATGTLASPLGLAGRLLRRSAIGWCVGLGVAGGIFGGVVADADRLLSGNPQVEQMFRDLGGSGDLTSTLLGTLAGIAGLAVAGQGIAVIARWRAEENDGRIGLVLAAPVGRGRVLAAAVRWALLAPAASLLVGGLAAGISLGAHRSDVGSALADAVPALLVQIPAVWVMVGLAVALLGWRPGGVGVAWAALGLALLLGQVGALLQLPQWVLDLSPFTHVAVGVVHGFPLMVLVVVAAALVAAGIAGYARRDVRG